MHLHAQYFTLKLMQFPLKIKITLKFLRLYVLSIVDKMIVNKTPHINIPPNTKNQPYMLMSGFLFSCVLYFDVAVIVLVVVVLVKINEKLIHGAFILLIS